MPGQEVTQPRLLDAEEGSGARGRESLHGWRAFRLVFSKSHGTETRGAASLPGVVSLGPGTRIGRRGRSSFVGLPIPLQLWDSRADSFLERIGPNADRHEGEPVPRLRPGASMRDTHQERRRTIVIDRAVQRRIVASVVLVPTAALAVAALVVAVFCRRLVHEARAAEADLPSLLPLFLTILGFCVVCSV